MINIEHAFVQITSHPAHLVGVKCVLSQKTFQRQMIGINKLYRAPTSWWRSMLLGKDITCRINSDIYEHSHAKAMVLLETGKLNNTQQRGVEYLRSLPNGIGLITGPAATGKTAFIERVVQPFLLSPTDDQCITSTRLSSSNPVFPTLQRLFPTVFGISETTPTPIVQPHQVITLDDIPNGYQSRVLMCTPDNGAADELAERVFDRAATNPMSRNAIIIRAHSVATETDVLEARSKSTESAGRVPAEEPDLDLPQLTVASMLFDAFRTTQIRQHGVRDKRYIMHSLRLATWMLRIAGLAEPRHPRANSKRHSVFAAYFNRVAAEEVLDNRDQKAYGEARRVLREHTLSLANVVVTTLSNTGDASIYTSFIPQLIVMDEATRAVELDVWNILGNYPKTNTVMIGDENQLLPVVQSTVDNNGFGRQLRLSLFQRLKRLGHPSVQFDIQYRMVAPIATMVSKWFYSGQLHNGEGIELSARPLSQTLMEYFRQHFKVNSLMMSFKIRGSAQRDATKSLYNRINVSEVLNLFIPMITNGIIQAQDLTILTFYQAQRRLYQRALRSLVFSNPRMAGIRVRTVDSMQGSQARFIILDVVTCSRLGFMRLRNRINVACSRPMDGLVIAGDVDGIMKEWPRERRHLGNVINHLKQQRFGYELKSLTANPHVPTVLNRSDYANQDVKPDPPFAANGNAEEVSEFNAGGVR